MKQTLTATTTFGTFTRTTNHDYKFVVISCGTDPAYLAKRRAMFLAFEVKQAEGYKQVVDGKKAPCSLGIDWYKAKLAALPQTLIDMGAKFDREAEYSAERIAKKAGTVQGWTSRMDLAEKLASQARKEGAINVTIFPVDGK